MTRYLNTPITLVWGILAALMIVSWMVGDGYLPGDRSTAGQITIALMVIAFFKVRLVMLHFMEAKVAPLALRLLVELYVLGVCATVLLMYFRSPA